MKAESSQSGFAMVFVFAMLLILSALGVGLLAKSRLTQTAGIRWEKGTQQEWNAQAGMEEACEHLWNDGGAGSFYGSLGAQINISALAVTNVLFEEFLVTSTTVQDGRTVTMEQNFKVERTNTSPPTITFPPLYLGAGTTGSNTVLRLGNNIQIRASTNGTLVFMDGNVVLGQMPFTSNTTVYISGDSSHTNQYIIENTNFPVSTVAVDAILDRLDSYDALIAAQSSYPTVSGNSIIFATNQVLVYQGRGNASVSGLTISGPGTLIINGDLNRAVNNVNVVVQNGATLLVRGSINLQPGSSGNGNLTASGNSVVYAGINMSDKNHATSASSEIYVRGNLTIKNNLSLSGLTYVGGTLTGMNNPVINGVIIAGAMVAGNNAVFNLDFNQLPQWLKDLLAASAGSTGTVTTAGSIIRVTRSGWRMY
jgi:hypothetical protein